MLISTPEELRLYAPANAIDHIDTLAGFLDSSEHDFLAEKLGPQLHASLVAYYQNLRTSEGGLENFINSITQGTELPPYARLLTIAQRIVAFDALGRAIDMQAISVNGSGINISTADDYQKADRETVLAYKATCTKEAHAAVNRLLVLLEEWTKETPVPSDSVPSGSPAGDDNADSSAVEGEGSVPAGSASGEEESTPAEEKSEIVALWRSSRFFYLAAGLVIPSATVLQDYLNIYDSREKFITMLPDLRTIQEDIIAPIIGEDFLDYMIAFSRSVCGDAIATSSTVVSAASPADSSPSDSAPSGLSAGDIRLLSRILHRLRKAVARYLESRTQQMKLTDPRRNAAHDEAVQLTTDLSDYLSAHQGDLPSDALEAFTSSPLYKPAATAAPSDTSAFENNAEGSVIFVTPSLS